MMNTLVAGWYQGSKLLYLLLPLSYLYRFLVWIRRSLYRLGVKKVISLKVPVVVVGNITVGGTGKTPLIIYLTKCLMEEGWRVGIVSRGYKGTYTEKYKQVTPESLPAEVGDEPVLLARKLNVPVVVSKSRAQGALFLQNQLNCNVILSDDGLQHYALARDIEILVIDGVRRYGNGLCLPAGPLREPVSRHQSVDFCVVNGEGQPGEFSMWWESGEWVNLKDPSLKLKVETGMKIHAVAGVGNPDRFFDQLKGVGFDVMPHPFPDHYAFQKTDFDWDFDQAPILMTEKDAVKCLSFADEQYWYWKVDATVAPDFRQLFISKLNGIVKNSQSL